MKFSVTLEATIEALEADYFDTHEDGKIWWLRFWRENDGDDDEIARYAAHRVISVRRVEDAA